MTGIIFALLAFAAWRDLATRMIPNAVSFALIIVGAIVRLCNGWEALGTSTLVAVGLFLVMVPLNSRGLVGGADLKLLAALAFGLSPLQSYQLIVTVTLCGGALASVYLVARFVTRYAAALPAIVGRRGLLLHRIVVVEIWRVRKHAPLPYGLAIAAGAALAILQHQGV